MKERLRNLIGLLRYLPAAALILSGILHAVQPLRFAMSTLSYVDLPAWILFIFIATFPYAIIALGVAIVTTQARSVYLVAVSIFALFSVAQGLALASCRIQDCGCFGYFSDQISWKTVSIPFAMTFISVILALTTSRVPVADKT